MKGTPFMSAFFFCSFPLDREVIQEYSLNKHMNKCSYDKTKKEKHGIVIIEGSEWKKKAEK
jgi:hypothetical protein